MQGKVIFFSGQKGWGFIEREDGEADLFVHFSSVVMDGYKNLKEGQKVTFDLEVGGPNNRLQATNVHIVR